METMKEKLLQFLDWIITAGYFGIIIFMVYSILGLILCTHNYSFLKDYKVHLIEKGIKENPDGSISENYVVKIGDKEYTDVSNNIKDEFKNSEPPYSTIIRCSQINFDSEKRNILKKHNHNILFSCIGIVLYSFLVLCNYDFRIKNIEYKLEQIVPPMLGISIAIFIIFLIILGLISL